MLLVTGGRSSLSSTEVNFLTNSKKLDNFQHCLLQVLLLCFLSSSIKKNEQNLSKFKNTDRNEKMKRIVLKRKDLATGGFILQ